MSSTWGQRPQYGEFKIVGAAEGHPKLLGEGSFGKTFEAVRADSVAGNVIEERVALKVLDPGLLNSTSKRVQFVREHTALTRLKHANLVHSIKCGEDNGEVYFAMELCMGGDLAGLARRFGALPERTVALIGRQAASGLREMHRREMVHRDIKPPNIMLFEALPPNCTPHELTLLLEENDNLCRIVDFGLVGTIINDADAAAPVVAQKFVGTMMYASPEQILRHKKIDGRADIYALGLTLWYLAQGRGPLLDEQGGELRHAADAEQRHLSETPHEAALPDNLSKEFRKVLAQMLAKRPEDRFAGAKELTTALERYIEKSGRARPISRSRSRGAGLAAQPPSLEPPPIAPEQSREGLHSFFSFDEKKFKSAGRQRFVAENCSMKQMARLTIVEDLDEPDKIRKDFEEVKSKVFAMAHVLRQPGVPDTVLPVQDVIWAADALAYAEDVPGDVPLSEVIQARTASKRPFSFREAEAIFRPIAAALDYLAGRGWDFISLPCEEVWLSDAAVAIAPEDQSVLCRPLDEWTGLRVTFSGMWVPQKKSAEQAAEGLLASVSEADGSVAVTESLRPPVSAFLRLIYRTLSGSEVPDAADRWREGYISSVALQTSSNNLIRDLLCKQRKGTSVSHILNELCENEGVSVDASQISRSERSSSRSRTGGASTSRVSTIPGSSFASAEGVSSSRSAAHSAHASAQGPAARSEPSSLQQSARASVSSSAAQSAAAEEQAAGLYRHEKLEPRRGKLVRVSVAAAAVVSLVVAFVFYKSPGPGNVASNDKPVSVNPDPKPGALEPEKPAPPPPKPPAPPKPTPEPVPTPEPPKPALPLSVPDGYATIGAAIAAAKPGETVRIKNGSYEEQIRLLDGVSLAAEESRRVSIGIESRDGSVLEVDGCKTGSTIKGIVFLHKGTEAPDAGAPPVVNVIGSKLAFEDCVFEKGRGTGVLLVSASVSFTQCEARRNGAHGFLVKTSNAKLKDCLLEGNGNDGLRAYGAGCIVEIEKTVSRRNGDTGLVAENGARISARKTDSVENSENGVAVLGADSEAFWQEGVIQGNGVSFRGEVAGDSERGGQGVVVEKDGAFFSATETIFTRNWKAGVVMKYPKSNSSLSRCRVEKNQGVGVIIYGAVTTVLRIEDCHITGNDAEGLVVSGAGFRPVIARAVMSGNSPDGLAVFELAEPQIEGCKFEGAGQNPINRTEAGPGMTVK